ncbi:hypothetical protein DFH08DRAFT_971385 [Mycena albidolilacea]|uniref:Uncharacterized protein n=1 Tax=Mycena albidolilacea TaxID=1033008 RepID=A0AAD6ZCY0_9AGAR|nr:hypothetical protein DFH08DRAFT_971385 [Mycena albidolilacea]
MRPIRRSDSEVTHVSDSEPECEAVRREQQESSPLSSRKSFHYSPRAPLTQISNTPKHARIHRRIATIEKELADIKQEVQAGTSDAGTAPGSLSLSIRKTWFSLVNSLALSSISLSFYTTPKQAPVCAKCRSRRRLPSWPPQLAPRPSKLSAS